MLALFSLNFTSITLSLLTMVGIVLHDTQIDKATTLAASIPTYMAHSESNDQSIRQGVAHTHVERMSFGMAVHEFNRTSPRLTPRGSDDKKYALAKKVARGHHAFDNYMLPIV